MTNDQVFHELLFLFITFVYKNLLALDVTTNENRTGNLDAPCSKCPVFFSHHSFCNSGNAVAIDCNFCRVVPDKKDKFSGLVEKTTVLEIYVAQLVTFTQLATASLRICRCWLQPVCICLMWSMFSTSTWDENQEVTFSIKTCDKNILLPVNFHLRQKTSCWESDWISRANQPRERPALWMANIIIYLWDPGSPVYMWNLGGQVWNGGCITAIICTIFPIFWYAVITWHYKRINF